MLKMDNVFSSTWDCAKKDLPDRHFDAIFFNDVLEHMVDPEQCLREAKSKLADSGIVYASIPNVIFIENIAKIVWRRDWKYECAGIIIEPIYDFIPVKALSDYLNPPDLRARK